MIAWLIACRPAETLDVFAASSLAPAFTELERRYEANHPGTDVRISTAGSQVLRIQLDQGASADVFASADRSHLLSLSRAGDPVVFAHNAVVLATPEDRLLPDLNALSSVETLVVAGPSVPVGAHTEAMLRKGGRTYGEPWEIAVRSKVISEEHSVRQVRARLVGGDADAGFVYRSDLEPGLTEVVGPWTVPTEVTLAVLDTSPAGQLWADWLQTPEARQVLAQHGFRP